MIAISIGISSGLLTILLVAVMGHLEKKLVYGLILAAIGFLYVGFTWTDLQTWVVNAFQAILFLFLAYYGIKKNAYLLVLGFFLHGCWDIAYNCIAVPGLVPPHYDLFCSSLDFTLSIYLLVFYRKATAKK